MAAVSRAAYLAAIPRGFALNHGIEEFSRAGGSYPRPGSVLESTRCSSSSAFERAPSPVAAAVQESGSLRPRSFITRRKISPPQQRKLLLPCAQAGMRLGMANGEEFELQREQRQAAILCQLRVMLAQRAEALRGSVVLAQQGIDLLDSPADPMLQQRRKNIFFAFEVRVERSARIARRRRDIFQARGFKPFARKYPLGRFQKFPPRRFGPRSLP